MRSIRVASFSGGQRKCSREYEERKSAERDSQVGEYSVVFAGRTSRTGFRVATRARMYGRNCAREEPDYVKWSETHFCSELAQKSVGQRATISRRSRSHPRETRRQILYLNQNFDTVCRYLPPYFRCFMQELLDVRRIRILHFQIFSTKICAPRIGACMKRCGNLLHLAFRQRETQREREARLALSRLQGIHLIATRNNQVNWKRDTTRS